MADRDMLSNMEFEERLESMGDNQLELLKFVARNQYRMSLLCPIHDGEIKALQNRKRKELGATGGIGAVLGVAIASAIDFLLRRG